MAAPTFLAGDRLPLAAAPLPVREWVGALVGGVRTVADTRGGMSQGVAAVVAGPAGRVFVKAVGHRMNAFAFDMARQEADAMPHLPSHPSIPQLLGSATMPAGGDPWVVLAFEAFDGTTPAHPWQARELARVLDAWADLQPLLHRTPAGWAPPSTVPEFLGRWRLVADDPTDPWYPLSTRWAAPSRRLAAAAEAGRDAVLAHNDLRADNIVLGSRVGFVDWAHPGRAAPWVDVLLLVLDVVGSGADVRLGGEVDVPALWRTHPATRGLDDELLASGAAALAGALHLVSRQPVEGLPHRQSWSAAVARNLLRFAERCAS